MVVETKLDEKIWRGKLGRVAPCLLRHAKIRSLNIMASCFSHTNVPQLVRYEHLLDDFAHRISCVAPSARHLRIAKHSLVCSCEGGALRKRPAMQNTRTFIVSLVDHVCIASVERTCALSVKAPLPDTACLHEASLTLLPYSQN